MARVNLTTICTVMTLERKLLICLVVALVVASASTAWGDTISWTFTTAGNYTVSDATKVEVADGVAKLIAVDQTDNDNASTGFGGGTLNETQWDGTNNWLELTATGQTNGSGDYISRVMDAGAVAAWSNISWIPQRPLYKELPNNKGIESGYPEGNADMTGNVLLMHFKRPEGMELPNYGEIETFAGGADMTGNVLLMHMNEASGTIVDYSGQGNNGTNSGALYSQTGKFNTALSFDGVDDYVEVPDNSSLDITDKITVEAWMKPSSDRWKYKKPISISGSSSGLTDHQVKVVVDYDSDMQADYDDLRFVDANGNILSYWIENYTASNATVWVKVPSIPTSGTTIYMYYGNPSASSASSGANTFIFFDNFPGTSLDGTKWTATSSANVTVNNGVRINAGDIYTNSTVSSSPQNKIFEMKARYHNGTASYSGINIANAQSTQGSNAGSNALAYNMTQSGAAYNLTLWGANGTTASYNIVSNGNLGTPTLDTDYIIGFSFYGSTQISYFYQNTSYTDVNRLTYSGTWNQPFYLWLGYFTGSTAGGTDIDDITVRWVRVRKYTSPEPTASVGNKTAAGISKAGAYGIGANTTTAFASMNNQMISGAISSGWNHITFTYDKNAGGTDEMKLYVNGVQTATKDYSTAISTNTNNLWVGDLFNGTIDEVAIYNRVFTADEIADHYLRGITLDSRGEENNGTIVGAISTSGKFNTALSFDGVDDYVEVPDSSSLDITDAVTIEAWINSPDFKNQYPAIAAKWNWSSTDPQRSYSLYLMDWTKPCIMVSSDGTYQDQLLSATQLVTNTWYHLTGVFTGSKYIIYINGAWDCELNVTKTIHSGTAKLSIGASMKDDTVAIDETFTGIIDEVAIYNRVLSATEIADHYKRGALKLKYQVRSCDDAACDIEQFIGPDGTASTYYSELDNFTISTPSLSLTNVSNNRYFQYKAYLETDNSSYSPELKSVLIGPTHYPGDNPAVRNNTGQTYAVLNSLVETLGVENAGSVKYQISDDGTNWYYWNASNWVAASGYSQTNTAAEVNTNCGQFDEHVGPGDFHFKAFLHSDAAAQQVELDQVDLGYTPIVISVWVSDSTFTFGTNPLNTWLAPQTSVITNDGTVAENFIGRISQFTDGANTWGISSSVNGVDTIRVQWSTTNESGPWTDISAYDTDFTIATNVAANDSVTFWFRIQTPTSTSSYNQHSSTLTVTAQEY